PLPLADSQAQEHGIPSHVGGENMTKAQIADRINSAGSPCQHENHGIPLYELAKTTTTTTRICVRDVVHFSSMVGLRPPNGFKLQSTTGWSAGPAARLV